MPKRSRDKGNNYERRYSKLVIAAFESFGITKRDCYRTPLSGGHPLADAGDLTISDPLWKLFPFAVECKHYKNWNPGVMFRPRKQERGWLKQVKASLPRCRPKSIPLLAMSGNATGDYTAIPLSVARRLCPEILKACPRLYFPGGKTKGLTGTRWIMVSSIPFLESVARTAKRRMKEKGKQCK